ncbi:hypothetical protein ACJMK2_014049, partial [Sinanodonta woodiana]
MEKVSFVIFILLSPSDGHNILNRVIPESSLKENVDRLEFSPLPNWPDSQFYEEDGPDIKLRCSLSSKTKRLQMKWYRNNMELDSGQ